MLRVGLYAECDVPGVEEEEVTIFLVLNLIQKTTQVDGVKVNHPEEGSDCDRVLDPDEENDYFLCVFMHILLFM